LVRRRSRRIESGSGLRLGAVLFALGFAASPAAGGTFRVGEIEGLMNLTFSYGLLARTEDRDPDLIGIANGGNATSVNFDDGNLNYDVGVASNMVRGTGELGARWGSFGAFVRAFALYDFENDLAQRARTDLSGDAIRNVGWDVDVRDYYLSARFTPGGMPIQIRVGDQVVGWGESRFLRFGVDNVNPIDLIALFQPASSGRDLLLPEGMVWAAASPTETISVEGYYQYDWDPARLPPVGTFFSNNDAFGAGGASIALIGGGRFSDLGTDLDAAFALPPGTLGFDRHFATIFSSDTDEARSQGQFGFTVRAIVPALNATHLALHFENYHSRRPFLSGVTPSQEAVDSTTRKAVAGRAAALAAVYESTGLAPDEAAGAALATAETLTTGTFANAARFFAEYPEDIQMLGFSFNTATVRTGTLISGDVSHHFDAPLQIWVNDVLAAALSPIQFDDSFGAGPLGEFGPNEVVTGFIERDRTQVELGITQLLGPRLGAAQAVLSCDFGWVHIHDMPSRGDLRLSAPGLTDSSRRDRFPAANSMGYRLVGQLIYTGIFGGLTLRPRVAWIHDFHGTSPGPLGAFIEDRKTLSVGLNVEYTSTWTADLSYTSLFGAGRFNTLNDRDFLRLNLTYHY
jgi:hypothetical protein